ncbi:MAG: class A beta-lactamase-related serine hydrolase [bacterium]|nr:class A beta-lactamase-related serine hydrolase [bacterium]
MGIYRTLSLLLIVLPVYALPPHVVKLIEPVSNNISLVWTHLGSNHTQSWRPHQRYNPASLIKLPVLTCLYNRIESGTLLESDTVVYHDYHTQSGAGILKNQKPGNRYRLDSLAEMMLRYSDNTATGMLIEHLGRDVINNYMQTIGMDSTWLRNPRLTQPPQSNQTTAMDIHQLLIKLARYELISPLRTQHVLSHMKKQIYRWGIPHRLPRSYRVANKTGTLGSVRHDAGLIIQGNNAYVLTILTDGLPENTRSDTIASIAEALLVTP